MVGRRLQPVRGLSLITTNKIVPRSSSGLRRCPVEADIVGSNPTRGASLSVEEEGALLDPTGGPFLVRRVGCKNWGSAVTRSDTGVPAIPNWSGVGIHSTKGCS
jgi:hypothetical protein